MINSDFSWTLKQSAGAAVLFSTETKQTTLSVDFKCIATAY